jgi:hypothetical protein
VLGVVNGLLDELESRSSAKLAKLQWRFCQVFRGNVAIKASLNGAETNAAA